MCTFLCHPLPVIVSKSDAYKSHLTAKKTEIISTASAVLRGELKLPDVKRAFRKDVSETMASVSSADRTTVITLGFVSIIWIGNA